MHLVVNGNVHTTRTNSDLVWVNKVHNSAPSKGHLSWSQRYTDFVLDSLSTKTAHCNCFYIGKTNAAFTSHFYWTLAESKLSTWRLTFQYGVLVSLSQNAAEILTNPLSASDCLEAGFTVLFVCWYTSLTTLSTLSPSHSFSLPLSFTVLYHSLIHSSTHSLSLPLTHSVTHSFIHSLTHLFTLSHSLTHSPTHPLTSLYWHTHTCLHTRLLANLPTYHTHTHTPTHLLMQPPTHSLVSTDTHTPVSPTTVFRIFNAEPRQR